MTLNALRFKMDTLRFLDERTAAGDTFFELQSRPERRLLVWQPEGLAEIFRSEHRMRLASSSTVEPLSGHHSLLFANGPRHTAYRKVIGARLRGRPLAACRDTIRQEAEAALEDVRPGSVVNLPEWSRALALRIISRVLFGHVDHELLTTFTRWLDSALGTRSRMLAYRYLRLPPAVPTPWRTFQRRRADLCDRVLRAAPHATDGSLTAVLRDGEPPLGALGDDDLTDQVLSLLFAGHETTASAMTSALYWLGRHPDVLADVRAELAATSADGAVAEDVPLLDAVCREVLRISPPAMIAGNRVLTEDMDILGHRAAAGTRLTPCIYAAHRQTDLYPDPLRFDPGRFLGQRTQAQRYLPFGGGTRRCLGADFASMEMRMVLAAVLRTRDVRVLSPHKATFALRGQVLCFGPTLLATVG
ncbi:cytochrome P450 [Lentzea sp. NPDC051838]|uniref:cytochrome P450 n=1 Tax=Lentzea sp. NPDC051838 TaxID=3154849 RepID=UPI00342AF02F